MIKKEYGERGGREGENSPLRDRSNKKKDLQLEKLDEKSLKTIEVDKQRHVIKSREEEQIENVQRGGEGESVPLRNRGSKKAELPMNKMDQNNLKF